MSDTDTCIPRVSFGQPAPLPDETSVPAVRSETATAPTRGAVLKTRGANALAPVIDIDRLYDAAPGTASQMVTALELLREASDNLASAQRCDSAMEADGFAQRAQLVLPRLFACRSIGDGFGIVINSVHFAFANLRGMPLTHGQLNVLWRVLRELRLRPAMTVEQGVRLAEDLEAQGLVVDPLELGDLLEASEAPDDE
jgi:hypothetical protein